MTRDRCFCLRLFFVALVMCWVMNADFRRQYGEPPVTVKPILEEPVTTRPAFINEPAFSRGDK